MTLADIDGADPRAWSTALTEATTGGALALAIDPRGERAAMGMVRGAVVLIDLRTGEATAVDSPHGAASEVVVGARRRVVRGPPRPRHRRDLGPPRPHDRRPPPGPARPADRPRRRRPAGPGRRGGDPLDPDPARGPRGPEGPARRRHGGLLARRDGAGDRPRRRAHRRLGPRGRLEAVRLRVDRHRGQGRGVGARRRHPVFEDVGRARGAPPRRPHRAPLPTFGPRDSFRRMVTMHGGSLLAIGIAPINSLWSLDPETETSTDISGCEAIEWVDADISPDARSAVLVGLHGEVGRVLGDACTPVVRGLGAFRGAIADDGETLVIASEFAVSLVTRRAGRSGGPPRRACATSPSRPTGSSPPSARSTTPRGSSTCATGGCSPS
jgi:hypothetical protein